MRMSFRLLIPSWFGVPPAFPTTHHWVAAAPCPTFIPHTLSPSLGFTIYGLPGSGGLGCTDSLVPPLHGFQLLPHRVSPSC